MKRHNPTFSPRLKVANNGNATLSGIPIEYMRHILTTAELYWHQKQAEYKPQPLPDVEDWPGHRAIIERNNSLDLEWYRTEKWIYERLMEGPYEPDTRPLKMRLQNRNMGRQAVRSFIEGILGRSL